MAFTITDNPIADYDRYDAEQQAQIDKLPVCSDCERHIQEDYYCINGECICEDCMEDYKRSIDDFYD